MDNTNYYWFINFNIDFLNYNMVLERRPEKIDS